MEMKDKLAPLKENLRYHLKKHHRGQANSVTVRDLARELLPIRTDTIEIREAVKELGLEGVPIVLTLGPPRSVYFAENENEIREWTEAMLGFCEEIWQRKCEIEKMLKMKNRNLAQA